ncbi:hypothetical protein BCV70DRAFT_219011 [Testicularia cyperi]|uniref:Uncharacterized protein n=1 Tax=Testicularia cyperi TaxID=1882483 RepID=A0A317XHZ9_9BASI|nr:hypothetical protein BCV70DRAFT_219011 [Testicularia cyperi]
MRLCSLAIAVWLGLLVGCISVAIAPPPLDTTVMKDFRQEFYDAFVSHRTLVELISGRDYGKEGHASWAKITDFPSTYYPMLERGGDSPRTRIVYAVDRITKSKYEHIRINEADPGPYVYRVWKLTSPEDGTIEHDLVALTNIESNPYIFTWNGIVDSRPEKFKGQRISGLLRHFFLLNSPTQADPKARMFPVATLSHNTKLLSGEAQPPSAAARRRYASSTRGRSSTSTRGESSSSARRP